MERTLLSVATLWTERPPCEKAPMTFQQFSTHSAGTTWFCGVLVRLAESCFVPLGPDPFRGPCKSGAMKFCLEEGGGGRRAHLPSKFSFSSDFCHFVLKMFVNAKFSFVSRKWYWNIRISGAVPPDFSTGGDASPRPPLSTPVGPWFVPRGPWFDVRGPDPFHGALICIAGPDPSRGTRIRSAEPWCFPRGPETWLKIYLSWGQSRSRGSGFGLGGKRYVDPRWLAFRGSLPECSPWDRHWAQPSFLGEWHRPTR